MVSLSEAREVSIKRKKSSPFTRFLREFSFIFTWFFAKLGVSPNFVTVLGVLFAFTGSLMFIFTSVYLWVLGWLMLVIYLILDCVDGDLAVIKDKKTDFGAFLDKASHPVTNSFLILFTAIGAYKITGSMLLLVFSSTGATLFAITAYLDLYRSKKAGNHKSSGSSSNRSLLHRPVEFLKNLIFGPGGLTYPLACILVLDLVFHTSYRVYYPFLATLVGYMVVSKRVFLIRKSLN